MNKNVLGLLSELQYPLFFFFLNYNVLVQSKRNFLSWSRFLLHSDSVTQNP